MIQNWAPHCQLVNGYGPTECAVTITRARITADLLQEQKEIPIGWPVHPNQAHVLSSNQTSLAPNQKGELWISGPSVGRGYLNRVDLTAQKWCYG